MMSCNSVFWLRQISSEGGFIDNEVTAVAVMPWWRSWSAAVMMVTVDANRRMAAR